MVAVSWTDKAILLGECKWGAGKAGGTVARELRGTTGRVVPGKDWDVHYAVFARAGFSDSERREGEALGAMLVDLDGLEEGLAES